MMVIERIVRLWIRKGRLHTSSPDKVWMQIPGIQYVVAVMVCRTWQRQEVLFDLRSGTICADCDNSWMKEGKDQWLHVIVRSVFALCVRQHWLRSSITDSITGVRLAAAVDERAGTKAYRAGLKEWSHVKRAFEYWAERIRERLLELRQS